MGDVLVRGRGQRGGANHRSKDPLRKQEDGQECENALVYFTFLLWSWFVVRAGHLSVAFITRAVVTVAVGHPFLTLKVYGVAGIRVL